MPTHSDAIGYLNDLANEINEPWFKMICDLSVAKGASDFDKQELNDLIAIYTKKASYKGIQPTAGTVAAAVPIAQADFLEQLSGFSHFKLLGDSLKITFGKQITLIFGANGSGKSSLCESLKALATPGFPSRPLENVRENSTGTPTFHFKFRSDATPQTWTPSFGYGSRKSTVKYFDTAIAIQNVKNELEPGRVIILSPFRLNVFELVTTLTTRLRGVLQQAQRDNTLKLINGLAAIQTEFGKFKTRPLAVIDEKTVSVLSVEIKLGEGFKDEELLIKKLAEAAELEKATSETGLKLLRSEYRELESLQVSVQSLLDSAEAIWTLDPANKAITLKEKQAAQLELAKLLIPKDNTLDDLLGLLRAASVMCKLDNAKGHACPLCQRDLGVPEIELFKQYNNLISGELEKEIIAIKTDIAKANELAQTVKKVDTKARNKFESVPADILSTTQANADLVASNCVTTISPTTEARTALAALKSSVASWTTQLALKDAVIKTAETGREPLLKKLSALRAEIEPLEYAKTIAEKLKSLQALQQIGDDSKFWADNLPLFTQVLRKITEKAKYAYEELVVSNFEARLDAEYVLLAEKNMAAFGVKLARKGADAAVTVVPQIGRIGIESILSEGEQRLHALAMFFAELETSTQSIVVFDDPISSFSYNYIANYCNRLRDFVTKFQDRQIIVFTHNWEFFVQLQTTLNRSGLNGSLSVHVLENCSIVADYSENVNELKKEIEAIFNITGEPVKAQKEDLAGKLRRLIEAVVNTHVFNNQRHQFKQKNQPVSDFQYFTKVTPLQQTEATTLRDLYSKLSPPDHDDPQNSYINTDKAMFKTRYDSIVAVESAIVSRIP